MFFHCRSEAGGRLRQAYFYEIFSQILMYIKNVYPDFTLVLNCRTYNK